MLKRIGSDARKAIGKTTDTDRVIAMVRNKKVFYSKHPNEVTIDNSHKLAEEVAKLILDNLRQS